MLNILKNHKVIIIALFVDLFLYWLAFYSSIVLPVINPSVEQYRILVEQGTSFPRDTNQCFLWMYLQIPITLYIFAYILKCFLIRKKS
ncbi:hypothetical protein EV214_103209 [Marinisporobacter balticus]|uniref:Uncharacterized protein n=1 Tax=Marinisporobacter balticus TaxID=2018667 RepID=A0A4R2L1T3_9FIRM|nr:hypothetical protein EV214_103209 [Marinisporobacter balticus]